MSDTETVAVAEVVETTPADAVTETPDPASEVDKWKSLARKNEQRAKDNADKAKRFDEIEDANRSEVEKLQAKLDAAEKAATTAEAARVRSSVAARTGVPEELLSGSTEEELEAAAERLLAFKGTTPKAPSADGQGKVGETIAGVKQITSRDVLKSMSPQQIEKARAAGQLDDLLGKTN